MRRNFSIGGWRTGTLKMFDNILKNFVVLKMSPWQRKKNPDRVFMYLIFHIYKAFLAMSLFVRLKYSRQYSE